MSGSSQSLGRVQPIFRDAWDSAITYAKLDNVSYNYGTYFSIKNDNINREPGTAEASGWWVLGCMGARGSEGPAGDTGPMPELFAPSCTVHTLDAGANASASITVVHEAGGSRVGYQFDLSIPRGADGSGNVRTVDNKDPSDGNIQINAVSYASGQALNSSQQLYARQNIGINIISNEDIDSIVTV